MLLRCFKDLLPASSGACSFGLAALLSRQSSPAGALAFTRTLSVSSGSLSEGKGGGAAGGKPVEESGRRNSGRSDLSDPSLAKLHVTNLSYDLDIVAVVRLFEPFGKVHWASFLTKRDPQNIGKYLRKRGEAGDWMHGGVPAVCVACCLTYDVCGAVVHNACMHAEASPV